MTFKGKALSAALGTGLVAVAFLVLPSASALAAFSHANVEETFAVGAPCEEVRDIAVLEAEELIYVSCQVAGPDVIKRFDFEGEPVDFTASAPYISGNMITGNPGAEDDSLESTFAVPLIEVDNSPSVNHGRLFVTSTPNIDYFDPSGEYAGAVHQPMECLCWNQFGDVDVGPDGSIYVSSRYPGDRISKFTPAAQEVKRLYASVGYFDPHQYGGAVHFRVDNTGAMWVLHGDNVVPLQIDKFEADQFTDELGFGPGTPATAIEPFVATPSLFTSSLKAENVAGRFDVDLTDNDLYVDRGNRIETYSQGNAEEFSYKNAPDIGVGPLSGSRVVAVTQDHRVFASSAGPEIVRFGLGDILPDVHTFAPDIDDVGHTTATVRGKIELAGGQNITSCKVEYGTGIGYGSEAPCTPDPAAAPPGSNFSTATAVKSDLAGLTTGQPYHYRFRAGNEKGSNVGIDRTVTPAHVIKLQTLAAKDIDENGATLVGSFDPDGSPTTYRFDYGITTDYGFSTTVASGGGGFGVIEVEKAIAGLPSGRTFHYRIVATGSGTTIGPDRVFRTASPPDVSSVRSTEVTATSALIHAKINPVGYATEYQVEYGTAADYGQVAPATKVAIGSGTEPVTVSQKLENLREGVTYHFRIVATNKWGDGVSNDTTFDFSPPSCPNDHIRQQTGSSYLPDCRAYELVSPEAAGAVLLYPSNVVAEPTPGAVPGPYLRGYSWTVNRGFASSPPRFSFFGGQGSINGLRPPNSIIDTYMSTRTPDGWVTSVPGLGAAETEDAANKECSESMDLCVDYNTFPWFELGIPDHPPYLFTAAGKPLGRLPTNLNVIPGARGFEGAQRMSGDFSHYVFSSTNITFAPGGVLGELGSAYDNDIADQTVTVISKLQNGLPIPQEVPTTEKAIDFRGLSPDGSHVLMQTPAPAGLAHLFMRVNQMVTYDVSRGAAVEPIGMTRDGSKVYFITTEPLTVDDTDTSADLYMWSEPQPGASDAVTRLSQGNGEGDSDACSAGWGTAACGVRPLAPERLYPAGQTVNTLVSVPLMDDVIAERAGDVYFFSPENLDPDRPAIKNERNLYVYRNGAVHLVATFDAGTTISRMQISPDGAHAAMVTASQLTSYDNQGFRMMYTYDPDTGVIRCASCNPAGTSPAADVRASQGGRFMDDNGRAFFSTEESLVPRDTNGRIFDTYEYVGGRPQLISSGQGSRHFTGGSEIFQLVTQPQFIGLEHVSHDGQDVYFSTFETLLNRDHNGEFVKFYDARTGGGFPEDPNLGPCAAADECHGVDSAPPPTPGVATSDGLGSGGNVQAKRQAKKKKRKAKHKRKAKRRHSTRTTGGRQ